MSDTDPDYPAMVLANYMFGGSITAPRAEPDSQPGRAELRRQFPLHARRSSGTAASFGGAAISNPQNTPKVEASFRDELAKTLANGFTADEVAAAKKALRDQRTVGRSQDAGLLGLIVDARRVRPDARVGRADGRQARGADRRSGQRGVPPPREPRSAVDRQGRRLQGGRGVPVVRGQGSNCTGARPTPCTVRFTASTRTKIAAAGASVHGASATSATLEASCSMVPHVGTVAGNPSPT